MRQSLQGEVAFFMGLELIELEKGQMSFLAHSRDPNGTEERFGI